jgi:hypothetical protein
MTNRTTPPQREHLWRGAVLASIGHAVWIMADPLLNYELAWEGPNYQRQDSQGTRGTMTFAPEGLIGVFRDDQSSRAPWHCTTPYRLEDFFAGIPPDLRQLAEEEALMYVRDAYDGQVSPLITTAFWASTGDVTAAEPWSAVLEHGGHLIARELMDMEEGLAAWREHYGWSAAETDLIATLFMRRMATDAAVVVSPTEWECITRAGTAGIDDARVLLEHLGFILP